MAEQTNVANTNSNEDAPQRKLSVGKRIFFLFIVLSLTAVVSECVLRIGLADTEIRLSPKIGGLVVPYRPNSQADLVASEFRVRYLINSHGFRDRPTRELANPKKVKRVALFGDSFTEGYGVQFDETYGQVAERQLAGAEVWNLAKMGSSPMFYVIQARHWLPKINPDLIVIQIFDNDLKENQFRQLKLKANGEIGELPEKLLPGSMFVPNLRDYAIVEATKRFSRYLRGKTLPRRFVRVGASVSEASLALPKHMTPEDSFYDFHSAKDLKPWQEQFDRQKVLLAQLFREIKTLTPNAKILLLYAPHARSFQRQRDGKDLVKDNPHAQLLSELCQSSGVQFIHSGRAFANPDSVPEDYYYKQDLHWNRKGHKAVGEFLTPIFKAQLAKTN